MAKKAWPKMTPNEKLDALRADIKDIADFINPLVNDLREVTTRLNEMEVIVDDLRKKAVSTGGR